MNEPALCPFCGVCDAIEVSKDSVMRLCMSCGMVWNPAAMICDVPKERGDDRA